MKYVLFAVALKYLKGSEKVEISISDVKDAYRKLKSYVYHDNTSLHLRQKIAEYERPMDFEMKLRRLAKALENPGSNESMKYFKKLIDNISYHVMPKKIELDEFEKDEFIISNRFQNESYQVSNITYLIDAEIEVHLISVLWIINVGYILAENSDLGSMAYKIETEFDSGRISKGIRLFKPYYKQYQKWRDDGIRIAKAELEKNKDIIIISLDIKDYYHSVRLSFEYLKSAIEKLSLNNSFCYLTDILEKIHIKYSSLFFNIKSGRTLLPIGLLSSGILANWYLKKFDKKIRSGIRPLYYGRYVDDIFIVAEDTKKTYKKMQNINVNCDTHKPFELYIDDYFISIKNSILSISSEKTNEKNRYKIADYSNLYIQKNKVKLYIFNAGESIAVLNQFEKNIRDNSSEFRFLPEEEIIKKHFEDNAYSITYSDSVNKLRSIEEFKCNKYEASKYLANEIFSSRLWECDSENKRNTAKQILTFFRGRLSLEFYSLWEKIFTYFIINNLKEEFYYFCQQLIETVLKIRITDDFSELQKGNHSITKTALERQIKESIVSFIKTAIAMPLALNLNFIDSSIKSEKKVNLVDVLLAKRIRRTNLLRHAYVFYPLFNYSKLLLSDEFNLLERKMDHYIVKGDNNSDAIEIDDRLLKYSPRFIHFHEASIFVINRKVFLSQSKLKKNYDFFEDEFFDRYLDEAYNIFYKLNYEKNVSNDNKQKTKEQLRQHYPTLKQEEYYNIVDVFSSKSNGEKFNFQNETINIAVANIAVSEENLEASICGSPILSKKREDELFKLLNLVTKENSDIFVMPETSVPYSWLPLLAKYSHDHQKAIVCGLEHLVTPNKIAYNFIATILPFEIFGYKSCLIKVRLKNHYAPKEIIDLRRAGCIIPKPKPYKYDLFIWRGTYFSCYYCYEIADIIHRSLFKSKVDFLIASVFNQDVNYFSNIVESASRDIHCYIIQVNSSDKGDTRITMPSKTETRDILKIKGGNNITVLTGRINIKDLREFQKKDLRCQSSKKEEFKVTPPDFEKDWVERREQGIW